MANLELHDLPQRPQPPGQVKAGRQALPPRGRPQPGEIDHIGVLTHLARTRERIRGCGDAVGIDQHHVEQGKQGLDPLVMAVR